MPARDQWANWKEHPCTQAMMAALKEDREEGFVEVSGGADDNDLIRLGIRLGKVNAMTVILNYGFIPEEDENDRASEG